MRNGGQVTSSAGYQTLMRWEGEGRVGYSHIADFAGLGSLAKGMADRFGVCAAETKSATGAAA